MTKIELSQQSIEDLKDAIDCLLGDLSDVEYAECKKSKRLVRIYDKLNELTIRR